MEPVMVPEFFFELLRSKKNSFYDWKKLLRFRVPPTQDTIDATDTNKELSLEEFAISCPIATKLPAASSGEYYRTKTFLLFPGMFLAHLRLYVSDQYNSTQTRPSATKYCATHLSLLICLCNGCIHLLMLLSPKFQWIVMKFNQER